MTLNNFRLGSLALLLTIVLAACGGSEAPDPGGPQPPGPGEPGVISGVVRAAPAANLHDVTLRLCAATADCTQAANALSVISINTGTSQAAFEFRNVPAGNYTLLAFGPTSSTPTVPPSLFIGESPVVAAGTSNVWLQLEFSAADPTDGTAALTGVLYLPGGLGSAATRGQQLLSAAGLTTLTATAQQAPEGLLLSNDVTLNRSGPAATRPGEIVVTFKDDVLFSQAALGTLSAGGMQLQHVAGTPGGRHLYEAAAADLEATLRLAEELRQQPHVHSAAPNWILHSFATPNDSLYPLQWHYEAINMPAAWDINSDSPGVTVAVLDTGSINHADLNFTGGYNFVTAGSGRGSNPVDPGRNTNYHGAHVAGTIGALTNNRLGVAGMSWDVTLVPVRVLGDNGQGTSFDILDGISWAAGDSVRGAPNNPNPARVLNLSLGASLGVSCRDVLGGDDSFFSDLANRGVITVVAAGNDNVSTNGVFPANCPGVITVGATGTRTSQAPYSNYGSAVDVMAPGGDMRASFRQDGRDYPYGVLSTVLGPDGSDNYSFSQGTSMAAPHVSGLVALMLGMDRNLTFSQVLNLLRDNTSASVCGSGCGSGLIDAAATLASIGSVPPPPEPPAPPPAGDAVTYLVLHECLDSRCNSTTPSQYVAFNDAPPGGIRYIVSNLRPGDFRLQSWLDLDDSSDPGRGVIDITPEDPYYEHPAPLRLQANRTTSGIDLWLDGSIAP